MLRQFGYTRDNIAQYQLMSQFHHQRTPLIVLVYGSSAHDGRDLALADQLIQRMNLPAVVRTDILLDIVASVWPEDSSEHSQLVARGVLVDVQKCIRDGKTVVIAGMHITHELVEQVSTAVAGTRAIFAPFRLVDQ